MSNPSDHFAFMCSNCDHVSCLLIHMRRHLKKMEHSPWTNSWHSYISKIVRLECKIFKRKVFNDIELLVKHVRYKNKMTLSYYSMKLDCMWK